MTLFQPVLEWYALDQSIITSVDVRTPQYKHSYSLSLVLQCNFLLSAALQNRKDTSILKAQKLKAKGLLLTVKKKQKTFTSNSWKHKRDGYVVVIVVCVDIVSITCSALLVLLM